MHAKQKRNQNFKTETVPAAISNIPNVIQREQNDEIRAIYGAGNYVLSPEYKKFQGPSHRWHSWSEQRKKDHISKFHQYSPTVDDTFAKPSNSGRKPGYQRRQRNVSEPNIIVDRSEQVEYDENPITPEENARDSADLSFCDPQEREGKVYELHARSKLPKSGSKCQGKCGRPIKDEDIMVIRSYRKVSWTDKATGKEKQWFGPMYLHFKEDCLKNYGDKYYTPGEDFPFNQIKIDPKTLPEVKDADKEFLKGLGIM